MELRPVHAGARKSGEPLPAENRMPREAASLREIALPNRTDRGAAAPTDSSAGRGPMTKPEITGAPNRPAESFRRRSRALEAGPG